VVSPVDLSRLKERGIQLQLDTVTTLCAARDPQERYRTVSRGGNEREGVGGRLRRVHGPRDGRSVGLYTSPHLVTERERIVVNGAMISRRNSMTPRGPWNPTSPGNDVFRISDGTGISLFPPEESGLRRHRGRTRRPSGRNERAASSGRCHRDEHLPGTRALPGKEARGHRPGKGRDRKRGGTLVTAALTAGGPGRSETDLRGAPERVPPPGEGFPHPVFPGPGTFPIGASLPISGTFPSPWLGRTQARNAALALCAVEILSEKGLPVDEPAVRRGLKKAVVPGRMEILAGTRRSSPTAPTTPRPCPFCFGP
jgi:dihydrofolate synthase/folylpolyglutamate synthase